MTMITESLSESLLSDNNNRLNRVIRTLECPDVKVLDLDLLLLVLVQLMKTSLVKTLMMLNSMLFIPEAEVKLLLPEELMSSFDFGYVLFLFSLLLVDSNMLW